MDTDGIAVLIVTFGEERGTLTFREDFGWIPGKCSGVRFQVSDLLHRSIPNTGT